MTKRSDASHDASRACAVDDRDGSLHALSALQGQSSNAAPVSKFRRLATHFWSGALLAPRAGGDGSLHALSALQGQSSNAAPVSKFRRLATHFALGALLSLGAVTAAVETASGAELGLAPVLPIESDPLIVVAEVGP